MKLVCYCRVSSQEQAEEGVSLAAQESRLRAWCGAMGHEVVEVVTDPAVSGSVAPHERPGFSRALGFLSHGKADGVVAIALDRLSRDIRHVLALVEQFSKEEWSLLSLRESLDTSSATGRFLVTVLGALAQMQREVISENTSAALMELRRQGKRYSRFVPFGYSEVNGRLVVNENEQRFVTALAQYGLTRAANKAARLNAEIGPHPRTGRAWTSRLVETLRRSIARAKKA